MVGHCQDSFCYTGFAGLTGSISNNITKTRRERTDLRDPRSIHVGIVSHTDNRRRHPDVSEGFMLLTASFGPPRRMRGTLVSPFCLRP